jgi:hypothetical protein
VKARECLTTMFIVLLLAFFLFPREAHAYLDPGTGSYIIQIALAAIVGIGFGVRLFWGRIKSFFKRIATKQESDEADES